MEIFSEGEGSTFVTADSSVPYWQKQEVHKCAPDEDRNAFIANLSTGNSGKSGSH